MAAGLTSRDVLIQTERMEEAREFYQRELGMTVFLEEKNLTGLDAGSFRLFVERGPELGPVFEIYVPDVESARDRLAELGAKVVAEDRSVPKCYVRDPFGLTYNLAAR